MMGRAYAPAFGKAHCMSLFLLPRAPAKPRCHAQTRRNCGSFHKKSIQFDTILIAARKEVVYT
jgi:hypothetical protein